MRLTTVIILASLMQVSAATFGQRITINQNDAPLTSIFKEIRKQSGYDFYYNSKDIPKTQTVTIAITNASLEEALKIALKGSSLNYEIDGKIITIKKAEESLIDRMIDRFQAIDIRGKVVDSLGNGLAGATVSVKGSRITTSTAINGDFYLKNINESARLVISYLGYVTQEVEISREIIRVVLKQSESKLDEVQVIAYGTTTRRLNVGNVSTVKAEDIVKSPVSNPILALQGRVTGVQITQNTGISGGGITVRIQGQNSLGKGNDPFYVVDGVPFTAQMAPTMSVGGDILGMSGGVNFGSGVSYGNPLNYINPSDIESIDVLKDADATAIYGSRASNGAILITTKKGKAGETKADINIQRGWGGISNKIDLLNTREYVNMRRRAFTNSKRVPSADPLNVGYAPDLMIYDTNQYTDWQNVLVGRTAKYLDARGTVSGGNNNTQFILSTGYHNDTSVFPGDFADQKGSFRLTVNSVSPDQRFQVQATASYLYDDNKLPGINLMNKALLLAPNAPSLYNNDGTLNWAPNSLGMSTWVNPLAELTVRYRNQTANLIGSSLLSYKILPGLQVKTSLGYNKLQSKEFSGTPLSVFKPERRATEFNSAAYSDSDITTWIIEPQATYITSIGSGVLDVLVGTSFQRTNTTGERLNGVNYTNDLSLENPRAAASITVGEAIATFYNYNAIFGRLNYNWNNKYILNINARRDGSSRFGSKNLFHNFGSFGGAWIFSDENFIKNNLKVISFGKLKASYGTTGNDQIGDYQFMNLYNNETYSLPFQGGASLTATGLTNPYLQWEETRKLQFGIDLGFLKDRVLLNASYSVNRSSNLLLGYSLPITAGFGDITLNFPATIQNTSTELAITSVNISKNKFKWTTNFNITIPRDKLVSFENLETSSYANLYQIGSSVFNITKAFHFLGLNAQTGLFEFNDEMGNPTSTAPFRSESINTGSKFNGGILNSFSFRDFQLDFLFSFDKQTLRNFLFGNPAGFVPGSYIAAAASGNHPKTVLDPWFASYYSTSLSASSLTSARNSDISYSDASYIRLKNLSFSWNIPAVWLKKLSVNNARVFIQGQNLLTFTKYDGLDPETKSLTNIPVLKMFVTGIQIGL